MKSLSKAAIAGSMLMSSSAAFAVEMPDMSGYYYSVQYMLTQVDISNSSGKGTASSPALSFEMGTKLLNNDIANLFLEGMFMVGVEDGSAFSYNGGNDRYTGGISAALGLQVKAHRQFNESFAGFFSLGLLNMTVDVTPERQSGGVWGPSASNPPASYTSNELIYSLGGEYSISKTSAITLSYNYLFGGTVGTSDVDMTSYNIGYKAMF